MARKYGKWQELVIVEYQNMGVAGKYGMWQDEQMCWRIMTSGRKIRLVTGKSSGTLFVDIISGVLYISGCFFRPGGVFSYTIFSFLKVTLFPMPNFPVFLPFGFFSAAL